MATGASSFWADPSPTGFKCLCKRIAMGICSMHIEKKPISTSNTLGSRCHDISTREAILHPYVTACSSIFPYLISRSGLNNSFLIAFRSKRLPHVEERTKGHLGIPTFTLLKFDPLSSTLDSKKHVNRMMLRGRRPGRRNGDGAGFVACQPAYCWSTFGFLVSFLEG